MKQKLKNYGYNSVRSRSTTNTAPQLARETVSRLFPRNASTTATVKAAAPLMIDSVEYRIAGNVMAVRQA